MHAIVGSILLFYGRLLGVTMFKRSNLSLSIPLLLALTGCDQAPKEPVSGKDVKLSLQLQPHFQPNCRLTQIPFTQVEHHHH
ncbi:hypothetical protein CRG86_011180 [Photobacterium leiognathi]|nr:hypothetical protein CRG86_011180 [Photobacterium leiognathi]